jgi:colanic acid biosynthesis glycosyl transferase WcaI
VLAVLLGSLAKRRGGHHAAIVHDIQSGLAGALGMVQGRLLPRLIRQVETFALNRADRLIVLSERMREALMEQGVRTPIEVLPIWIDTQAVRPLPPAPGPPVALYSGNLGRKQGLGQVLDLAANLLGRSEVRILVRGEGTQAKGLAAEAGRRGLSNLRFEALLPPERLNEGLAAGHIHLVPQDPRAVDYAVPSKVMGIMAAGRPFVATAGPGSMLWRLREESEAFVCVPPNDGAAFAAAVLRLADDPDLRAMLGRRARSFAERHFDRRRVLGRLAATLGAAP